MNPTTVYSTLLSLSSPSQGRQCDSRKLFVRYRMSQTVANCLKQVITDQTGTYCHKPFAAHKPAIDVIILMHVFLWLNGYKKGLRM